MICVVTYSHLLYLSLLYISEYGGILVYTCVSDTHHRDKIQYACVSDTHHRDKIQYACVSDTHHRVKIQYTCVSDMHHRVKIQYACVMHYIVFLLDCIGHFFRRERGERCFTRKS